MGLGEPGPPKQTYVEKGSFLIFDTIGEVVPGFYVIGAVEVPSYLLDGGQPVLFDAGFSVFGPLYERDIKKILGSESPKFLFLTHVHFDHCGAAAYLKKTFPGLIIAASQRAAEIVRRPNARKLIADLNDAGAETVRRWKPNLCLSEPFRPFEVDRVLQDGDRLALGPGLSLQVIATPGHTWDFLSYYIPERKILIASEAVGCADVTGYVVTEFLVDFEVYLRSLKRLAALEVEVLCQGHRLVYTGLEVRDYLKRSIQTASQFKERVVGLLTREGGDTRRVVELVKAEEYDSKPHPKQPEPAYLLNLEARVKHLAGRMNTK
jgi:glyoxylase-like metal-dependent hydrolase (beta-lactamase superfamily II)